VQRLKTRNQFQAVLAGRTIARTRHFALHCAALDLADTASANFNEAPSSNALPTGRTTTQPGLFAVNDVWVGAMVPKRWAKRAVTRNAIKRQIYMVCVELKPQFEMAAHVVRLRSGFDKAEFVSASSTALKSAVRQELNQLFAKIGTAP
jgi:ribonuclease P protein component